MDMNYVVSFLEKIVNIPSPSGYTKEVMKVVEEEAKGFGYGAEYSRKGGLIITVLGKTGHCLGISAHVDTLGAMVRSVTSEGKLKLISVGGFTMELSDEGRAAAAKYLAETYEADLERWKQHPSLLDCEPWTPPTPEEEASGQS